MFKSGLPPNLSAVPPRGDLSVSFKASVNSLAVDVTSKYGALGGKRALYIVDLDNPWVTSKTLHQQGKWEVGKVKWNPHTSRSKIIASTANRSISLWNVEEKLSLQSSFETHLRPVTDLAWSNFDPNVLATCSAGTEIRIWDVRKLRNASQSQTLSSRAGSSVLQWNRLTPNILASSSDREIKLWDLRNLTQPLQKVVTGHTSKIASMDWSHTRKDILVSCGGSDRAIKIWDFTKIGSTYESQRETLSWYVGGSVIKVLTTPFGDGVVAVEEGGMAGGSVKLWSVANSLNNCGTQNERSNSHPYLSYTFPICEPTGLVDWRKLEDESFQLVSWAKGQTVGINSVDNLYVNYCVHGPNNDLKNNSDSNLDFKLDRSGKNSSLSTSLSTSLTNNNNNNNSKIKSIGGLESLSSFASGELDENKVAPSAESLPCSPVDDIKIPLINSFNNSLKNSANLKDLNNNFGTSDSPSSSAEAILNVQQLQFLQSGNLNQEITFLQQTPLPNLSIVSFSPITRTFECKIYCRNSTSLSVPSTPPPKVYPATPTPHPTPTNTPTPGETGSRRKFFSEKFLSKKSKTNSTPIVNTQLNETTTTTNNNNNNNNNNNSVNNNNNNNTPKIPYYDENDQNYLYVKITFPQRYPYQAPPSFHLQTTETLEKNGVAISDITLWKQKVSIKSESLISENKPCLVECLTIIINELKKKYKSTLKLSKKQQSEQSVSSNSTSLKSEDDIRIRSRSQPILPSVSVVQPSPSVNQESIIGSLETSVGSLNSIYDTDTIVSISPDSSLDTDKILSVEDKSFFKSKRISNNNNLIENIPIPRMAGVVFGSENIFIFINVVKFSSSSTKIPRTYEESKEIGEFTHFLSNKNMTSTFSSNSTSSTDEKISRDRVRSVGPIIGNSAVSGTAGSPSGRGELISAIYFYDETYNLLPAKTDFSKGCENYKFTKSKSKSKSKSSSTKKNRALRNSVGSLDSSKRSSGLMDDVGGVPGVRRWITSRSISHLLPVSKKLGEMYIIIGQDVGLANMCLENKKMVAKFDPRRKDLLQIWDMVAAMTASYGMNGISGLGICEVPELANNLIEKIFTHFEAIQDWQTCGMLGVVFGIFWKLNEIHSKFNGNSSLSEFWGKKMNYYKEIYAEFLYRWGELAKFVELRKLIKPALPTENVKPAKAPKTNSFGESPVAGLSAPSSFSITPNAGSVSGGDGVEFSVTCKQCKRPVKKGTHCSNCGCSGFYCVLCHLPVSGLSHFCIACGHGGHEGHMRQWFGKETMCPSGCGCECIVNTNEALLEQN